MISVEALCEHALTVSAAPDYCSEQIRSFFRDSRGSSARLVGQKREDIGGRLPTSLLEGRSAIPGFVFVPQPWGMLPAKLFSQICSTSGSVLVSVGLGERGSSRLNLVQDSASGENYGVAISLRERITDPGHIWSAEFLSSRGTEANLDQASPIHTFSRSAGAQDDGPVIPFGSLTCLISQPILSFDLQRGPDSG
ncbi:hypothetical protein U1Q18_010096 [Sarracenia purpurea var. burkii]